MCCAVALQRCYFAIKWQPPQKTNVINFEAFGECLTLDGEAR
jgi:hypothetical protein